MFAIQIALVTPPPDDCEKLTRIVDFPDRARRAVDPATITPVDRATMFVKNPFWITRINPANRINPIPDQPDPIPSQNVEGSSDRHDDCEKNPIPDRARRAVDPLSLIHI